MKGYTLHSPAKEWQEGTLLGNGTLGAVMMGDIVEERIVLNREDLFAPIYGYEKPIPMAEKMEEIRSLIQEKRYAEAAEVPWQMFQKDHEDKLWTNPYLPAADLVIRVAGSGTYSDYSRELDFETGIGTCRFQMDGIHYDRKIIALRDSQVLCIQLCADQKVTYTLSVEKRPNDKIENPYFASVYDMLQPEVSVVEDTIRYICHYGNSNDGYVITLWKVEGDGRWSETQIQGLPGIQAEAEGPLVLALCIEKIGQEQEFQRGKITCDADASHQERYGRIQLSLSTDAVEDETLYRETRSREKADGAFLEKIFNAGRYEILASTGKMPPNLQGVWSGTYAAPWSGDYTQNGNVQTAILGSMPCGDFESMKVYFDYQESMMEAYRENSQILYGCRGIHVPSRTSDSGYDTHFDTTWPMVFWIAGAGWVSRFYYDYWLYTGDDTFFRERALPFMKEAALFYEDYLFEDENGYWVFSPSYSPENTPEGHDSSVCINATMDISVAKELFTNLICGCRTLGIEKESIGKWRSILEKMPPYQINEEGALKEWSADGFKDMYDHRHASHLYLLYYDIPEDVRRDPNLFQACRKAYEIKMERKKKEKGTMAFGLIQAGMVAAHLKDAEMVETMLQSMACNNYYPTYASSHDYGPSTFNADISGGIPALMLEAIAQSMPVLNRDLEITHYEVRLLPALPASMQSGSVKGLRLRGAMTLDMEWKDGNVVWYELKNPMDRKVEIQIG